MSKQIENLEVSVEVSYTMELRDKTVSDEIYNGLIKIQDKRGIASYEIIKDKEMLAAYDYLENQTGLPFSLDCNLEFCIDELDLNITN